MKRRSLTPIEHVVEATTPNRVNYEIRVAWPDGAEPSTYVGIDVPIGQAADALEVLVDELRAAVPAGTGEQSA